MAGRIPIMPPLMNKLGARPCAKRQPQPARILRTAFGGADFQSAVSRVPNPQAVGSFGRPADWKSATQQGYLRYEPPFVHPKTGCEVSGQAGCEHGPRKPHAFRYDDLAATGLRRTVPEARPEPRPSPIRPSPIRHSPRLAGASPSRSGRGEIPARRGKSGEGWRFSPHSTTLRENRTGSRTPPGLGVRRRSGAQSPLCGAEGEARPVGSLVLPINCLLP